MSPEGQVICYFIAFVMFLVGAFIEWGTPRPPGVFFACIGLAAAVLVPLWTAIKAL